MLALCSTERPLFYERNTLMTGLFTRLFRVFQAEANATMSRLEDPVKLSEQGLRDLKSSLSEAMISLAQG